MKRFEYRVEKLNLKSKKFISFGVKVEEEVLSQTLNGLGAEGWDLVSAVTTGVDGWTTDMVLFLKREQAH